MSIPGICGFHNRAPQSDAATLASSMLARLRTAHCPIVDCHVDPAGNFALGRVSLGVISAAEQPVGLPGGRIIAVMDGELYDIDAHSSELRRRGYRLESDDHAAVLLASYVEGGVEGIGRLEGSFAAALVELDECRLVLISDRFGSRPVYYSQSPNRLSFASTIASLLADGEIPRELCAEGLVQFFTFGHYFGDHTSLAAVKVLPAGAVLTFDGRTGRSSVERYWTSADRIGHRPANRAEAIEGIDDAFAKAVRKRQTCARARIGLSLSGGLDARTILGTFDHSQQELTTVCMGMHGSHEHRAATKLAHIVGCRHHSYVLDSVFLAEFGRHLESMVRLTDGQYLSQCIVMPTLPVYRRLGIGVLLRGHAGELLHMSKAYNYSLDEEALRLGSEAALEDWLWKRLQAYIQGGVEGPLFARPELQGPQAARESLRTALADTPQNEPPAQRISHLFLDQRVRRETMLSMMKFRSVVEPRLPYLDRLLVERLMAIPAEWRLHDELQMYILRKRQPKFCRVLNTNTGTVMGAGKARRNYAKLKYRVFSKLGLPGYQPYERLGLWLRRDLSGFVRRALLNDACLDGGIFNPTTIRQVVERHLTGQRNHTYLIMALMIFERGHRWLLDRTPLLDGSLPTHFTSAV